MWYQPSFSTISIIKLNKWFLPDQFGIDTADLNKVKTNKQTTTVIRLKSDVTLEREVA